MLAGTILETSHAEHITGGFSVLPFPEDLPETWEELVSHNRPLPLSADEQL